MVGLFVMYLKETSLQLTIGTLILSVLVHRYVNITSINSPVLITF